MVDLQQNKKQSKKSPNTKSVYGYDIEFQGPDYHLIKSRPFKFVGDPSL